MRQSFAIPYKKQAEKDEFEEDILKAILVINDQIMDFKFKIENENSLEQKFAEWMLVNSFSQKDINNFDYNEVFREVFIKSIDLFEYVSSDAYFVPIYKRFLKKLQIQDYKEYIKTIVSIFTIIAKKAMQDKEAGQYEQWAITLRLDAINDLDKLINANVLDYISLSLNKDILLNENKDYKVFRDKPVIKMPDDSYEIINVGFFLERLFSSLYFDFKIIANELDLSGFEDQYKQSFMEKMLLCKYLKIANEYQKYTALSSKDIKEQFPKNGGEPDYYMRSDKVVILFESKDIMINCTIKESRDLDKIMVEYQNKLLLKTHSNSKLLPKNKQKPKGIGQLIDQIIKIQNGNAYWDKSVPKDSIIYPVLVIGDSKLLPDGLSLLMQKWYKDNCLDKVNISKARPLIVMSILTLLLYAEEFKENGFEYYFEEYYKSIALETGTFQEEKNKCSEIVDLVNANVSFSEYMKNVHPKNFVEIFNLYKSKIFSLEKSKILLDYLSINL